MLLICDGDIFSKTIKEKKFLFACIELLIREQKMQLQ